MANDKYLFVVSGSASQASTTPMRARLPRPKGTSTMLPRRTLS